MKVAEAMSKTPQSVEPGASLRDCARRMRELNIGCLPVVEKGRLVGIVTDRDVCCRGVAQDRDLDKTSVREVMSRPVDYCYEDQQLAQAAQQMKAGHRRRLPVITQDGAYVGMLSIDDLALYSHELAGSVLDLASPRIK